MIKSKMLSEYDVKDYQVNSEGRKYDMKIGVCGVFDTLKVQWEYYAVSYIVVGSLIRLSSDLAKTSMSLSVLTNDISNVRSYFRKFENQNEADSFLKDFKLKWETASNNTSQVIRDEKLNEILK